MQEWQPGCAWCSKLVDKHGKPAYIAIAQTIAISLGCGSADFDPALLGLRIAALKDLARQGAVGRGVEFEEKRDKEAYRQCMCCQAGIECFAYEVNFFHT